MMKVCHIMSGDLWAGAEVMAYQLLKGLRGLPELELSAIVLNQGRLAEEIRRLDIPCYIIDESKLSFPGILLKMAKILKESPVHILHSHRYKENCLAYLLSKTIKGLRLMSTQHGMPEDHGVEVRPLNHIKQKLNFWLLSRRFHAVVAVSQDMKASLIRDYGFREETLKVIHNGMSLPQDMPHREKTDSFVIGSAGRFFPVKDYPLMVEIARVISHYSNNASFILAGEGPDAHRIRQLVQHYGLEKVFHLPGFVDDMDGFYRELHLYLNTSLHEGIPMSILEAMAYGLPVVAPKVGGLKEIITDGVDGYLVEGRNPGDFADKCLLLYNNEALLNKMSASAREKIMNNFSINLMTEHYYRLYLDVTGI